MFHAMPLAGKLLPKYTPGKQNQAS